MPRLTTWFSAFRAWFASLDASRRLWLTAVVGIGVAGVVAAWSIATYVPMSPLFDDALDPTASNEVTQHLKDNQIPYTIERATDRIFVPDHLRDGLRLELTGNGMAAKNGVGLELFEDNRFGSTRFVEHIRYVRGLQGELERQINGFTAVRGSKVLLSIPEEALFTEDRVEPTASVYLQLKAGRNLSTEEGRRMASLVAAAVPRLSKERVEILDSNLAVIHAASAEPGEAGVAGRMADLKRDHERYYKREIERILERVVGPGKVVARVNVELDTAERSKQERKLHPDQAVAISMTTEEESQQGGGSAQGIPGTTSNSLEAKAANGGSSGTSGSESSKSKEQGNYEVPWTNLTEATLPGGIATIRAAVLVDGLWAVPPPVTGAPAAPKNAAPLPPVYSARTDVELASFRALVATSLGIAETSVTMVNQPFAQIDVTDGTTAGLSFKPGATWAPAVRYGFAFLALLCTFGFVVRPVIRHVTEQERTPELGAPAMAGVLSEGPAPHALGNPEADDREALHELVARVASGAEHITRADVSRLVAADLTHSVVTLQAWLHEE